MPSIFKQRREVNAARTKIGIDLHRQIRTAVMAEDLAASERLSSSFTVGYIHSFTRDAFFSLGLDQTHKLESHIKFICNGILHRKLFIIYSNQTAALAIAYDMQEQDKHIFYSGMTPMEVVKRFELGAESGSYDAPLVANDLTPPDNLRRYLLGEPLQS